MLVISNLCNIPVFALVSVYKPHQLSLRHFYYLMQQKIDSLNITFEYKEPLVHISFNKAICIDEKQLLEMIEVRNKLVNHKPHLVLSVFNAVVDFTDEARKAGADARNSSTSIAHAVVVKWLGQRLLTNSYKEIEKPPYPLQIFCDEEQA